MTIYGKKEPCANGLDHFMLSALRLAEVLPSSFPGPRLERSIAASLNFALNFASGHFFPRHKQGSQSAPLGAVRASDEFADAIHGPGNHFNFLGLITF